MNCEIKERMISLRDKNNTEKSQQCVFMSFFQDIDECTINTDNCHQFAICTNTMGSFTCACITGFTGNGVQCDGKYFMQITEEQLRPYYTWKFYMQLGSPKRRCETCFCGRNVTWCNTEKSCRVTGPLIDKRLADTRVSERHLTERSINI